MTFSYHFFVICALLFDSTPFLKYRIAKVNFTLIFKTVEVTFSKQKQICYPFEVISIGIILTND